jgi:hypothetical protein
MVKATWRPSGWMLAPSLPGIPSDETQSPSSPTLRGALASAAMRQSSRGVPSPLSFTKRSDLPIQREAASRHLEPFALALAFAVAVLLTHAQPEPDQRDDGHQRRRANRQSEA